MNQTAEKREREQGRYDGQFRPAFSRLHEDRDLLWVTPIGVRYVVGVVGYRCAGKSAVLSYLADKHNFDVYTLSALVREAAERRGLPTDKREILQRLGDELRAQQRKPGTSGYGDGAYLARLLLRRIHLRYHTHRARPGPGQRVAISGFKHPEELEALSSLRNFTVFLVDADGSSDDVANGTGLDARARRAYRTGILSRELMGLPDLVELAEELRPPGGEASEETLAKGRAAFSEHLDRPDRETTTGLDWIKPFGQSVNGVMALAEKWLANGEHDVVRLSNGPPTQLDSLHAEIDKAVSKLNHQHRTP